MFSGQSTVNGRHRLIVVLCTIEHLTAFFEIVIVIVIQIG